ncbi:hypothetical protein [Desulfonatronum thioautotrophicum]|uniref:hypothetical protein n=1 Tax=Desulfonatronum thioautotrophicum TaxID=617001 RepID=UPI0005EBD8DA|nr:hypothetical protein [Desulfonatronum thioautotrophicum]
MGQAFNLQCPTVLGHNTDHFIRQHFSSQALDHAKPRAAGSRIARSRLLRIRTGQSRLFLPQSEKAFRLLESLLLRR